MRQIKSAITNLFLKPFAKFPILLACLKTPSFEMQSVYFFLFYQHSPNCFNNLVNFSASVVFPDPGKPIIKIFIKF